MFVICAIDTSLCTMIPCDLLPCMYAESFPCAHSILCCCHSSVHLLSVTLPCSCAECDAMDAVHDLPGGHQHPLPPLCALALQCSQLCLCLHHQWGPLPGLPHGCGVHEPGTAAHLVASGHPRLQPNGPCCHPNVMVRLIMSRSKPLPCSLSCYWKQMFRIVMLCKERPFFQ